MTNRALLVGINYPGTQHALRGCVNDVLNIEHVLSNVYNFTQIQKLIDRQATARNIKIELEAIVKQSQPGDKIFFHFSGHGSQIINTDGTEPDGLDEILCPIDLDWKERIIRDKDINEIFSKAADGVEIITLLDCCHSGDGLDYPHFYQPRIPNETSRGFKGISRYIEPPQEFKPLNKKRTIKLRPKASKNSKGILISGCRSYQTSADAYIEGRYCGACTHFLIKTLHDYSWNVAYKNLIQCLNMYMVARKFTQRPELSGQKESFNDLFLNGTQEKNRNIKMHPSTIKQDNVFLAFFKHLKQTVEWFKSLF